MLFDVVWHYRWIDMDVGYEPENRDDYEFTLIEITDSALVKGFLARGHWQNDGESGDLRTALGAEAVRHFRIGFDDHGTYDVLCGDVQVERDFR